MENHLQEGAKYFSPIYSLSLLDSPISLKQAKELSPRFSAPQGYSYMSNYKELNDFLEKSVFSIFEINPSNDLDLLGLFTKDIVKSYEQEIATPLYLVQYI